MIQKDRGQTFRPLCEGRCAFSSVLEPALDHIPRFAKKARISAAASSTFSSSAK